MKALQKACYPMLASFTKLDDSTEQISQTLQTARRVLQIESDALQMMAEALDERFHQAVTLLHKTKGRVIICGMGKSGHIGAKIAATFASTGTPAYFVHPAEASHGDLGMILSGDVVLLLSNSGETAELASVIAYTRRFSIPLIGIASNPQSTLAKAADLYLPIPKAQEACSNGLAPTTSTTLTLALGDALAVALMQQRQFRAEQFRDFHPGGALGTKLSTVESLMHRGDALPLCSVDTVMSDVILKMTRCSFGIAGIIDQKGALVGVISDGDLRVNMDGLLNLTAREVMTKNPKTIRPDALAEEALALMNHHAITSLFVQAASIEPPLGLIHVHDCLRAGIF